VLINAQPEPVRIATSFELGFTRVSVQFFIEGLHTIAVAEYGGVAGGIEPPANVVTVVVVPIVWVKVLVSTV
jgi:hypothetical protein